MPLDKQTYTQGFNNTVHFETISTNVWSKKPTTFIFAVREIYPQSSEKEEEDKETDLCIVQGLKSSLFNFYTTVFTSLITIILFKGPVPTNIAHSY